MFWSACCHRSAQVNYLGLQLYNLGETQTLLASFRYLDSLVSWLALNDMLTLHVVHKPTKRSAKLHFLTREASQIKTMLTRCMATAAIAPALHPQTTRLHAWTRSACAAR